MSLIPVRGGRHICQHPVEIDQYMVKNGQLYRCDDCGRFWRAWIGSRYFNMERVGWWESRKLRRELAAAPQDDEVTE